MEYCPLVMYLDSKVIPHMFTGIVDVYRDYKKQQHKIMFTFSRTHTFSKSLQVLHIIGYGITKTINVHNKSQNVCPAPKPTCLGYRTGIFKSCTFYGLEDSTFVL